MSAAPYPLPRNAVTGRNAINAILWGGLVAGALDAMDGVVAYGFQGLNLIQVLQYIASGVLGPSSFQGGLATAGLGTLLHFFIVFVAAAVYVLASRLIWPCRHGRSSCEVVCDTASRWMFNFRTCRA